MAISVTLYNFTKKANSTARPSEDGFATNMVLKDNCSIFQPRLEYHLASGNPSQYTYAYIPDFSRYYFITDWAWEKGVWIGTFKEDCLATFKAEIGSANLYVLRSAAKKDGTITDMYYPATVNLKTRVRGAYITEWVQGLTNENGTYVLGVVNNTTEVTGSVCYYVLTAAQMASFRSYMLSSIANWDDITDFSGDVAKAFIDPFQYVVSCNYYPIPVPVTGAKQVDMKFGFWSSSVKAYYLEGFSSEIKLTLARPSRSDAGGEDEYLFHAPWAHYYAYIMPWGLIELNSSCIKENGIQATITTDFVTGKAILKIISKDTGDFLYTGDAQVGVPMQISNVGFDYTQMTSLSGLKNTAIGAVVSALTGSDFTASSILSSAASSNAEVQSSGSNFGFGAIAQGGQLSLVAQYYEQAPADNENLGSPLCKKSVISTLPGYNKVQNGSVNISGTQQERDMVRSYLEGGFYYE